MMGRRLPKLPRWSRPSGRRFGRRLGLRFGVRRGGTDPGLGPAGRTPPALTTRQAERLEAEARQARRARARRAARTAGLVGSAGALAVALLVAVFPTRTWLDQRSGIAEAEQRLEVLRDQNAVLQERIERLDRDDEIERLAREQYNLVLPGEEAYAVLPPPLPPVDLPALWPFGPLIDD